MPFSGNVFYEIALLLALAALFGLVGTILRQPLIIAFLAMGIVVGPAGVGLVSASDQIDLLSKLGIALLLFIVGLKLDLHLIRTIGPVAIYTGVGQIIFTSVFGYVLSLVLGLRAIEALYVSVALTFSSTIIIVKLLSDKKEIDALHGRIAVGFLIVQDIAVILAMIGLNAFHKGFEAGGLGSDLLIMALKSLLFLGGIIALAILALPRLFRILSRSYELLVLGAIAWAVLLAAAGDYIGLSKEVGAFLAGVSLASTPFREAVGARLVSLRDFLLLFFFIDLGAQIDIRMLGVQMAPATVLSLFVLIGNPIIVMVIMGVMGYRRRTGFLAGLTVAQISEFSLVLAALGVSLGHIGTDILGLITLVGLVTIGISTYMILHSHRLYETLSRWLAVFEKTVPHRERDIGVSGASSPPRVDVIIFGIGRYGRELASQLMRRNLVVLGVDFDPEAVRSGCRDCLPARYGDAEDPEFPSTLPLDQAKWVISTVPLRGVNSVLRDALVSHGFTGNIAVTAHSAAEAGQMAAQGMQMVLLPFRDAAESAASAIAASVEGPQGASRTL